MTVIQNKDLIKAAFIEETEIGNKLIKLIITEKVSSKSNTTLDLLFLNEYNVNIINSQCFLSSPFSNIILPDSVEILEDESFASSKITNIILPSNITYIGKNCFRECIRLKKVIFKPGKCKMYFIKYKGFEKLLIKYYEYIDYGIIKNKLYLGESIFKDCYNLTDIKLADNKFSYLSDRMFLGCNKLRNITLPDKDICYIGDECFSGCNNLKNINLPKNLKMMGKDCFEYCYKLKDIKFKNKI